MVSKYQMFNVEIIDRSQIKNADYNPRTISKDSAQRLKKMIAKHGLVQPLIWNKRTGNLVGGHRRLEALDALEKSGAYSIETAVVDVDEREEKILNVQLNNPSMMGDWDIDKLIEMSLESNISPGEMGFSESDESVFFGCPGADELFEDAQGVEDAKNTLREIKEHRKEAGQKFDERNNGEFYFTIVCENQSQKVAILKALGEQAHSGFVHAKRLAGLLGV